MLIKEAKIQMPIMAASLHISSASCAIEQQTSHALVTHAVTRLMTREREHLAETAIDVHEECRAMTEEKIEARSATVYQFPKRGRFAVEGRESSRPVTSSRFARAIGSAWYHDEAIAQERKD